LGEKELWWVHVAYKLDSGEETISRVPFGQLMPKDDSRQKF